MPTRARSFGKLVLGSPTEMPSTIIWPFWNGSSALTHLISVDFPDPDGPQTTTTSALATLVVQSFNAWKLGPYHLSTWLISIIGDPNYLNMISFENPVPTFSDHALTDDGDARLQAPYTERRNTGNGEV